MNQPSHSMIEWVDKPSINEADFKTRYASINSKKGLRNYLERINSFIPKDRARSHMQKSSNLNGDIDIIPAFNEEDEDFYSIFSKISLEESKGSWQGEENKQECIQESHSSDQSCPSVSQSEMSPDNFDPEAYLKIQNWVQDSEGSLASIREAINDHDPLNLNYCKKVERVRKYLLDEIQTEAKA